MKVYTVHTHPGDANPMENAILIREGFNFWAFIFSGIWALYHRLWAAFFGLIGVSLICNLVIYLFDGGPEMDFALALATGIGFGLIANDLRRKKLAAGGWKLVEIVASPNENAAEHRFFDRLRGGRAVHDTLQNAAPTPLSGSTPYP
ncbi:DUF2628 domain-containing protein [Thalassospira permensis]|uniref:DUF2628 domain-containing protein n=1 Tax=Thalassospira permensis NBRC 106175 TaxID=1353532 RepID=A0ABR4TSJ3_9PROT|nr:DUF2628 domain-containing protein [Thalassospira permensis]KEO57753.1 hypothetical protein SMB34_03300 [Thalassospira permensis NBRC 106175]